MKILILGHGGSGKDEAAGIIKELYGLTFQSSSMACLDVIFPVLSDRYGYEAPGDCYNDRHSHRQEWFDLISEYNTPDKSALARLILSKNDIYVGLRCNLEYEASRHLFDQILWIDASGRGIEDEPSMLIEFDPLDMDLIDNNGSLADLENNIVSVLGSPRPLHSRK